MIKRLINNKNVNNYFINKKITIKYNNFCSTIIPIKDEIINDDNNILKNHNNNNNNIEINNEFNNNFQKKIEKIKDEEEEVDENQDMECTSEKCGLIFKIPNKLRGKEGYCPKCSNVMIFKKHASKYKKILKKRRELYSNTLHQETKTIKSFDPIKNKPFGLSVLLEDCRSLHNVGSVFRTSDGAGFNHIYLCGLTGHPPNDQISKLSLGSEDMVNWSVSNDSISVIKKLKELNVKIIGIEQTPNSVSLLNSIDKIKNLALISSSSSSSLENNNTNNNNEEEYHPIAIIMGNEIAGMSNEAIELCDLVCELPMMGNKKSLNVSITYGIVSYFLSHHFKSLVENKELKI
ncbi:hypothetical protein ACTFIW_011962 [Dictyostelium discoideum]